ncbi:uncharacterized protein RVIR1_08470 [Candidatus Rickettsiella viridis]|uniref:Uncharacterized protein n=1 Tax=Candidatus Rickettsiella viridis TaxID=676208 RepID=A0A2Z5UW87_9COXI|nr:hypothetical protein [Candidatus Rickettsiella viridis]BBB15335.1 uncharacterized protein RVIR1_08470 [Candidatus Rickettsiella viridis]
MEQLLNLFEETMELWQETLTTKEEDRKEELKEVFFEKKITLSKDVINTAIENFQVKFEKLCTAEDNLNNGTITDPLSKAKAMLYLDNIAEEKSEIEEQLEKLHQLENEETPAFDKFDIEVENNEIDALLDDAIDLYEESATPNFNDENFEFLKYEPSQKLVKKYFDEHLMPGAKSIEQLQRIFGKKK